SSVSPVGSGLRTSPGVNRPNSRAGRTSPASAHRSACPLAGCPLRSCQPSPATAAGQQVQRLGLAVRTGE
ncbi:MAG: hypothetical protein M3P48_10490, partial [Actinomycetota bacterium]|nr:hypothetical protein [Actinomycetota bacterium]